MSYSGRQKFLLDLYLQFDSLCRDEGQAEIEPLVSLLRKLHWAAAFVGASGLADITAASVVFLIDAWERAPGWNSRMSGVLRDIHDCVNALVHERGAGGRKNLDEDAIHKLGKLSNFFLNNGIKNDDVSACRPVAVRGSGEENVAKAVPPFALRKHEVGYEIALVTIDIPSNRKELEGLVEVLEKSFSQGDILLHGTLIEDGKMAGQKCEFFVLLDTLLSGDDWLEFHNLEGQFRCRVEAGNTLKLRREKFEKKRLRVFSKQGSALSPEVEQPGSMGVLEPLEEERHKFFGRKRKKIRNSDLKIRFSVGLRLILIVSMIVLVSMYVLAFMGNTLFSNEIQEQVRTNNILLTNLVAHQVENEVTSLFDTANLLFQISVALDENTDIANSFFTNFSSLIYVGIPGRDVEFVYKEWFQNNRISDETETIAAIIDARRKILDEVRNGGRTVVTNITPLIPNISTSVVAIATPFILGSDQEVLLAFADVGETLQKSVETQVGISVTAVVNSDGEVLAHPDLSLVANGENWSDIEIVKRMYSLGQKSGQIQYAQTLSDGVDTKLLGSYTLIPLAGLGIVTSVAEKEAFAVVTRVQRLNMLLFGTMLSLALLLVFLFSLSITNPLKELAMAARKIKAGNWNISIRPKTSDEVGQLIRNFVSMIPMLEARERLRERVNAFINPQVSRMIDSNTLPQYAETKDVSVFFSDVRNFTSKCEKMGDPQLILDNLSEYFQAMVPCVEKTRGTVDKFIGDAIMAVWGSMQDLKNNAESAVDCAIMMRKALIEFNKTRGSVERPFFQIGCGINTGPATVGIMGDQNTKMEWAHMGDTVNLASRVEGLNKPFRTDILITRSTAERVKGLYELVLMKKVMVKGKSEPQEIYAVLGRVDDDTRPRSLDELRQIIGIGEEKNQAEAVKNNGKEVKYKVIDS